MSDIQSILRNRAAIASSAAAQGLSGIATRSASSGRATDSHQSFCSVRKQIEGNLGGVSGHWQFEKLRLRANGSLLTGFHLPRAA
ncbi:hypothetical protein C2E31_12910 [Rhodopirellula baltica]|nr:hypothetical protein C2E31_12910 [Rhodopirellula baltica]